MAQDKPRLYRREFKVIVFATDPVAIQDVVADMQDALAACPRTAAYSKNLAETGVEEVPEGTELAELIAANVDAEHMATLGFAPQVAEDGDGHQAVLPTRIILGADDHEMVVIKDILKQIYPGIPVLQPEPGNPRKATMLPLMAEQGDLWIEAGPMQGYRIAPPHHMRAGAVLSARETIERVGGWVIDHHNPDDPVEPAWGLAKLWAQSSIARLIRHAALTGAIVPVKESQEPGAGGTILCDTGMWLPDEAPPLGGAGQGMPTWYAMDVMPPPRRMCLVVPRDGGRLLCPLGLTTEIVWTGEADHSLTSFVNGWGRDGRSSTLADRIQFLLNRMPEADRRDLEAAMEVVYAAPWLPGHEGTVKDFRQVPELTPGISGALGTYPHGRLAHAAVLAAILCRVAYVGWGAQPFREDGYRNIAWGGSGLGSPLGAFNFEQILQHLGAEGVYGNAERGVGGGYVSPLRQKLMA